MLTINKNSRTPPHLLRKSLLMLTCAASLLGLAAVPAAAAPAAASAPASGPAGPAPRSAAALTFDSTGSGFAFYRGQDRAVYMRTFRLDSWSAQRRLGGVITGAPAAAVARTTVVVAARGARNALWVRMMHNGTWGRWASWGGTLTASPAVTGGTDGRIDVFIRGPGNALWTRTLRPGQPLTAWKRLGGRLTTGPAAIAVANGSFEVAAGGTDHAVWTTSTVTKWAWKRIGGRTFSTPALGYIPQSNGVFVLIRSPGNALLANGFGGQTSTGWRAIGSRLIDGPTAAGTRQPVPYIIAAVRRAGGALWTTRYPAAGGGWSGLIRAWVPRG